MIPKVTVPEGRAGAWRVERFTVTKEQADLDCIRSMFSGGGMRRGRSVPEGDYTRLMRGGEVIMSDTPAEMRDHYDAVLAAHGSVLINGLGLGMVARAVLLKADVSDVTVVEQSADVIALVAPHVVDPRLTIIHADALEFRPPTGKRFGMVWHDIWDDITSDNLPEMITLHRRYGRRADWQGSWARELCEMQRSRSYGRMYA